MTTEVNEATLAYIKKTDKIPFLDVKREKELAQIIRSHKTGKKRDNAINELISHNLKLAIKEAFRFSKRTGLEIDDLISQGNLGLFKAAEKYNPKKFKTKFATYATWWVRECIYEFIYKNISAVEIPVHIANGVVKHKKLMEKGGFFTDKQLQKELNVSEIGLQKIKDANISTVSLQQIVHRDDKAENDENVGDKIADENSTSPSENASEQDQYSFLYEALDELDETSKNIVMAQFLEGDKAQLGELGKRFSVSGERIRQIREKALKMLRKKIEIKKKHGHNGHKVYNLCRMEK